MIVDTAGRLQIDEELMDELERVRDEAKPLNVLLVVDAMTGQEAVNVAQAFEERIAFDGVVLTKLDGDARGGAALSVKAVTGKPIKFASTGEKLDALEVFHPDRMASRILGMGDVLTLIERAEAAVEEDDQAEMEKRMRAGQFTFDDFLKAYKMLRRMGPLQGILKMIPGLGAQLGDVDVDEKQLGRVEAIVLSMTPQERAKPVVIDGKRRIRIANGSGSTVEQVNQLLEARKQMEKMMKQMGRGKMPALPGAAPGAAQPPVSLSAARKSGVKRKKKKSRRSGASLHPNHRREPDGCEVEAHARGLEEESDLPRRRGRFALPARRQVPRDRRPVQPADGSLDDRSRRGEGQGLAREGRAADRGGCEADQDLRHREVEADERGRAARVSRA